MLEKLVEYLIAKYKKSWGIEFRDLDDGEVFIEIPWPGWFDVRLEKLSNFDAKRDGDEYDLGTFDYQMRVLKDGKWLVIDDRNPKMKELVKKVSALIKKKYK